MQKAFLQYGPSNSSDNVGHFPVNLLVDLHVSLLVQHQLLVDLLHPLSHLLVNLPVDLHVSLLVQHHIISVTTVNFMTSSTNSLLTYSTTLVTSYSTTSHNQTPQT